MSEGYSHLRDTARYQATTLIGGWYEERELRRSILKDLLAKKTTGTLRLDAYHQKMATALAEVELTKVADDGYVHFGDVIQLVHLETAATLACDIGDRDIRPGEEACAATAAPEVRSPCARNTFILLKYKPPKLSPFESYYEDDVLRYGQKIRLAANPMATGQPLDSQAGPRPLCLFSKPVSTTHYAKYCRNQLVGFTFRNTADTVWQVVTPEPEHRVVSEGVEVLAGAPILLMHMATQKPLLVEQQKYPNDFGFELELSARAHTSQGLKLAMEQTAKGLLKGSMPKPENSGNVFTLITGTKVERLPEPMQGSDGGLLAELASELDSKPGAVSLLERKLVMHGNQASELATDELLLLLRQVGSGMPDLEVAALAAQFATHKPGVMDSGAFLKAFRAATGRA
mmetsp:Transcript_17107/g.36945  ORF Transcript_17107/g.36945 Transcript_17107/m.36945 type:complete len:401 (-) Transcript_17107:72-1274(-)|eukprot:CAMPEP_0202922794 /NCGR_PEP_ID=MMETSP1392-20130828/78110_1 /ASSEMBLY_ACC=CAM_ASM_000868 /TAXON_ID=225041 /ORGANISM="Chlamydomonas chlamydogama, Strain SAG 11-48b" /LENGTH=400 /DNA_ID=CAMNT_0049616439 /DNA_START=157 /DNA_END=1359 /DNA_ORIENTATION=+